MKTLLCILLFSAAAFGQIADAERQDRREKPGCERIQPFPGVLLAPSDDQTITGAHSLIFQTGFESLRLFPGFQENHSAFAQSSDLYTHNDAGFRAPYINFYKSRGTQLAPTPVTFTGYEQDSIGGINFGGWDGHKYFAGSAALYTQSDENWTPTSHGGHLSIYGTAVNGGDTKQIAQFGGRGPNGESNDSVIFYRGLSFGGAQNGNPALNPTSNPPIIHVQKADGSGDAALAASSIGITAPHTPATAFDSCVTGTIAWDANFVYVCVSTNTWRRSALAAW